MDIPLGMMLTATALFQEVESPLGYTQPPEQTEIGGVAGEVAANRTNMCESIAEVFGMLEDEVRRDPETPEQIAEHYMSIRQVADQWERSNGRRA